MGFSSENAERCLPIRIFMAQGLNLSLTLPALAYGSLPWRFIDEDPYNFIVHSGLTKVVKAFVFEKLFA